MGARARRLASLAVVAGAGALSSLCALRANADQPAPAAPAQGAVPSAGPDTPGEMTRAPGAPPRTAVPEPVGQDLSWQYFFLHDNNYFAFLANDGWPPQVKFQISVRFEMVSFGEINNFAFNLAYTQTSFWDLFAISQSSPFIENDYRPELFLSYRPSRQKRYREVQIGVQHQSNGLGEVATVNQTPDSREWNYAFADVRWGIERNAHPDAAWFYVTPGVRAWLPFAAKNDLVLYEGYFAALLDVDLRVPARPELGRLSARLLLHQHNFEADLFYPIRARVRCWLFGQLFTGKAERLITAPQTVTHLYFGIGFQ
jgi:outer membrane phospholipase A